MRLFPSIAAIAILAAASGALGGTVPREPEEDNREYLLDIVTNTYSRAWREVWEGGDNRFRFRLGSNKVTQWFLEEELKVAVPLVERVRFRFHHARLFRHTTDEVAWDVLEFEGRVYKDSYLSLYARPTFDKREQSLGLTVQRRRAVNRYVALSVEWPGFMRNYFEGHRDAPDSLLSVFTESPVRFALDVRGRILPRLWLSVFGEYVPRFEMGKEAKATGTRIPGEEADARVLQGWIEYVADPSREVRNQVAFGIEAGYERSRKTKDVGCGGVSWEVLGGREPMWRTSGVPSGVPYSGFGPDFYRPTEDDTVRAWRDKRVFVSPYAWAKLSDRVALNGTLRYEKREIGVRNHLSQVRYTTNDYVVPRAGVSYAMGSRGQVMLEGGAVAEWRTRSVDLASGTPTLRTVREDDSDDYRVYLAFEYAFGESSVIRLNEGFELDARDRGQFGVHDHGFFQLIVGF